MIYRRLYSKQKDIEAGVICDQVYYRDYRRETFYIKQSLYEILQIINLSIFDKMPLGQLFQQTQLQNPTNCKSGQLIMFDL